MDIVDLKIDRKSISVVLNNRMRTESQMQLAQVQDKLGHSISATLTPAPEAFRAGNASANTRCDLSANKHDLPTIP